MKVLVIKYISEEQWSVEQIVGEFFLVKNFFISKKSCIFALSKMSSNFIF